MALIMHPDAPFMEEIDVASELVDAQMQDAHLVQSVLT
jgi:hypothetical protein